MLPDALPRQVRFTHHFHDQLLARFCIILTPEDRAELASTVAAAVDALPWVLDEESVELDCVWADGRKFCAVYIPAKRLMMTAITYGRTGHHKFVKKVVPTLYTYKAETREEYQARHKEGRRARIRKGQKPRRWRANLLRGVDLMAEE